MKVNVNLAPPDGYFFKDSDGSIHRASGWNGVIARVRAYRFRNKMPIGNPESEVTAQACARNPSHCKEENPVYEAQLKQTSLKGRVLQWLTRTIAQSRVNPIEWRTSAETAQARANVCAGCPMNAALGGEGCSSCKAAVKEMQQAIIGGRKIDPRINGCLALGESLPVSVWLDLQTVDDNTLPGCCWRRRSPPG